MAIFYYQHHHYNCYFEAAGFTAAVFIKGYTLRTDSRYNTTQIFYRQKQSISFLGSLSIFFLSWSLAQQAYVSVPYVQF